MTATDLEQCPLCGSAFEPGAPPERCPGCGFRYDEHTRIWQSRESWSRLAATYALTGLGVGILVAAIYRTGSSEVPNPMYALILAAGATFAGLIIRRVLSGRVTRRFVAVTSRGLLIATRSQPQWVPWSDFERLVEQRGVLRVQRTSSATPLLLDDIFASSSELAAFRLAVAEAAGTFRRTSGPRPGPGASPP